jgi:hypothetical protein
MRASLFVLVSLILNSCPLRAQSLLTFARVMDSTDLGTTGFALVNAAATNASVAFTLRDTTGATISSSVATVPAGGQLAKLASELFPNALSGGWVQAASNTPNLRGFWLKGDPRTDGDGAEAATVATELVLPLITVQSEIDLVNPGTSGVAAVIRLFGPEGLQIGDTAVVPLPGSGSYRAQTTALFQPTDLAQATHARVACMPACAGAVLVSGFLTAPSLAVINGANAASSTKELSFPHVVQGTLGNLRYSTVVSVTNLSAATQTITITFTTDSGAPPITVSRDLAANGTDQEDSVSLFGAAGSFQNGWVHITAEQSVTGIVVYAEFTNHGVAVTPSALSPAANLLLSHIADLSPWWTGVALLNPGNVDAQVGIFAITPQGTLIGSANITVPAGQKVARLLSEWIPQTQTRSSDGGFVFVRSTVPLYGTELFFTRDLRFLANVPAFGLGTTEQFTPPPPNR